MRPTWPSIDVLPHGSPWRAPWGYVPSPAVVNVASVLAVLLMMLNVAGWRHAVAAEPLRLTVLGDSLTAGYGLPAADGFTVRLEARLRAGGRSVVVLNAGVSGDTSAAGLSRLGWALADKPHALIVELGANDGLRGLDPATTEQNLDAILIQARQNGLPVLLAGMVAPPNLGREYAAEFNGIYARLAKRHAVALYPFFLEGVALRPDLNQADGIHPNRAGVDEVVRRILPHVERLLDRVRAAAKTRGQGA